MKEQKKKRVITILLLISCIISGYLLIEASDEPGERLQSFAQADSLIEYELTSFSIGRQQISRSSVDVDSAFSRIIYHIDLPADFSKTQLHAELNRVFYPLGISTPASISFPDKRMQVHLEHEGTIFRTLILTTDPDLVYRQSRASIIIALDELPDNHLLNTLTSFGEPIPIVLAVGHPMQASELQKSLSGRYPRILFWLQNDENEDLIQQNPPEALRQLEQFEDILPDARLLLAGDDHSTDVTQTAGRTDLTFINARDAFHLHEELGKASFLKELNKLKSGQSHTVAIINGGEITLTWLEEKLPDLKKAGVELVPPPAIKF